MSRSKEANWRRRLLIGTLIGLGSIGVTACGDINASGFNSQEKATLESTIHPEAERIVQLVMAKDKKPIVSADGKLYQYTVGDDPESNKPHYDAYAYVTKQGDKTPSSTDVTKIEVTEYVADPLAPDKAGIHTIYTLSLETGSTGETYWNAQEAFFNVHTGQLTNIYNSDSPDHSDQVTSNTDSIGRAANIVADLRALEPKL